MNRAILAMLCGGAIALTWAGNFDVAVDFGSDRTAVRAQEPRSEPVMTVARLEEILSGTVENLEGDNGSWQFEFEGVNMLVVTSEDHDRMRLVAPVASLDQLTEEQQQNMLIANFHTALDARYAIGSLGNQPAVVAVFLHPLSSLHEDHFRSALSQVEQAAKTFGTTYSSGGLLLGPNGSAQPQPLESDGNLEI